ncbi:hypothetical protein ACPOL_0580 [Acidisarcina polymorpha]|uniref:Uncharacterized protein n=1 Tax=Acidisarcina polymorpha TaxID=2211140 RepID=A0A2Z5FT12_9BACT|nr:hypothetical protein ACPOL_0580 [Acidisarcina polymorpha]
MLIHCIAAYHRTHTQCLLSELILRKMGLHRTSHRLFEEAAE